MIAVDSLLYGIDQRLNKLSTNSHQQIPLEDKILALNEAQIKLIKQKVNGPNTTNLSGLDSSKKLIQDLENLVVTFKEGELPLKIKDEKINQWSAKLEDLNKPYMFYLDSYLTADKGLCKNRKIWINKDLSKNGDVSLLLNNEHYKPSFEYQETFNTISSNEISVYTDGTFTPLKIYISYIRYPDYINKTGYVMLNGESSTNKDCELESYLYDELIDLTIQNLAMYTENQAAIQNSAYRIQTNI